MSPSGYAFLGLTAVIGVLVGLLAFAVLRFAAAARDASKSRNYGMENALLSSALEDAIGRLKAQERATAARAVASEQLSEQIVASLASGLVVVDHTDRIKIANPAATRILSLPPAAVGGNYREVLRAAPALVDVIRQSLETNTPVLRRTARVGETHLGVGVSPLDVGRGPEGAICLFTDLTSVVALEEQLRLKDSLARLGELTAGLAHEFRNGLATIHGYGRLLDPERLPEPYRLYVQGIRDETQALGEVVTNFLNFAKPDPLVLTDVDLRSLVARAAEDTPAAQVTIRGEFATIEGDEVLLRQAFSNLFRNSVDASTAAGKQPTIVVEGKVDRTGGTISLDVRDDGPGIPDEVVGRVFQPFFTTRATGIGLGLAIVQKVVVSHNGLISAGNRAEGGAQFRISFPLAGSQARPIL